MLTSLSDVEMLDNSKVIGQGAFSKVLKCRLLRDGQVYALKIVA